MHKPKALLTAWVQVVVGDPLDSSPLVNDRLNVLGLGNYALQHWVTSLRAESETRGRLVPSIRPAAAGAKGFCLVETVAHSIAAYNFVAGYNGEEAARLQARSSRELSRTPRR